jgi:hypothetical protein
VHTVTASSAVRHGIDFIEARNLESIAKRASYGSAAADEFRRVAEIALPAQRAPRPGEKRARLVAQPVASQFRR